MNILQPGPGVGGHCIAVDPWFIVSKIPQSARLIHTARKVNDAKPAWIVEKVKTAIFEVLQARPNATARDVTVACFGLAFKADIDDLRESPAMSIARSLANLHRGTVLAVEPNIPELPNEEKLQLVNAERALALSDVIVLLVDHRQFKSLDMTDVTSKIIDTRGIWRS